MEMNFIKADSGNLPIIDLFMVQLFLRNNPDYHASESRNVKTAVSSGESYGDDAVGYVQLFRQSGICTIKCRMCPEHKVRAKYYNVTLVVDENNSHIVSIQCHDCEAPAGGCKHAVAFLMWLHRRSEQPSCTSIECYRKKPTLSQVGASLKFMTVEKLVGKKRECYVSDDGLFTEFVQEAKKRKIVNCELLKYQPDHVQT